MNFIRSIIISCAIFIVHCSSFAQWSAVGNLPFNNIYDFEQWNGKLYIAGMYSTGIDTVCGVASYDGVNFAGLPPGFSALTWAVYNNELYVGGQGGVYNCNPTTPSIPGTANIARWDGSNWYAVGGGGPGGVEVINAMAVYNGELYAGGTFFSMGGVSAKKIARWDGTQWKTVGIGFPNNETVQCMTVYKGELYVGGNVGLPGGPPPNYYYNLVRWNGTQWDSVGGKIGGGWVTSLSVDSINNILYIGGGITDAGGVPCQSVAKWDSSNLSAPGMGITNGAYAMTMYQGKLIVGGSTFGYPPLATWDGTYWCAIDSGPNSTVSALTVYNGELYVGGYFDTVASIPVKSIVKWSGNLCPNSAVNENAQQIKFKVYPNPAKGEINIEVEAKENKNYITRIYNAVGIQVIKQKFTKQIKISTAGFSKGIYQVQVCDKDRKICHTEKVVIE